MKKMTTISVIRTLLGFLALIQYAITIDASFVPDGHKYDRSQRFSAPQKNSKLEWAFWWADDYYSENAGANSSNFAEVDCHLTPNLIYWEPRHIKFQFGLTYDWIVKGLGAEFIKKWNAVLYRCPKAQLNIDTQFEWTQSIVDQMKEKGFSIESVVQLLLKFILKNKANGITISFVADPVVDDKYSQRFFKHLRDVFHHHNLWIQFYLARSSNDVFRPVTLEYADGYTIEITDFGHGDTLKALAPAFGSGSVPNCIDLYLNMGAKRNKMTVSLFPFGKTFYTKGNYRKIGEPAAGLGSLIYKDNVIVEAYNSATEEYLQERYTVCRVERDKRWVKAYDSEAKVPYAYDDKQWLTYEDFHSIKIKLGILQAYGVGLVIDGLNYDDRYGLCGGSTYQMTRFMKNELSKY